MKRIKSNDGRVNISNILPVFPGRSKKGKSSHDDKYGHGQKKRRPSTYVVGKMFTDSKDRSCSRHPHTNLVGSLKQGVLSWEVFFDKIANWIWEMYLGVLGMLCIIKCYL